MIFCPRIKHFARLQPSGKISKCGHMIRPKEFDSFDEMQASEWLKNIRDKMSQNVWPDECMRCKKTEEINNRSIRLDMIERDKILKLINQDYIVVGGVLDNICNSACQTCNETLSSKIGSLKKNSIKIDNYKKFYELPTDRILELDVNGGEPTYSTNYKKILKSPPANVKIIRINTNAHKTFEEVIPLLEKGIRIIVTVSLDGLGAVHDYTRWPIKFKDVEHTIQRYQKIKSSYPTLFRLNAWTTVSVYNIGQFDKILEYTKNNKLEHAFALLENPSVLSVNASNKLTVTAKRKYNRSNDLVLRELSKKIAAGENNSSQLRDYISQNDKFRSISFRDYFNLDPNLL